jgi:uncharacterized protein
MKIILDTNVFFSAYAFNNKVLALVNHCMEHYDIYSSEAILHELKVKFLDGRMAKVAKNFEIERAISFIEFLEKKSVILKTKTQINISRDKSDNMFLELAHEMQAHFIITGDQDLLVIKNFEKTKIYKPSEFIQELHLEL